MYGWAFNFSNPDDLGELSFCLPIEVPVRAWPTGALSIGFIGQMVKWPFAVRHWRELKAEPVVDAYLKGIKDCLQYSDDKPVPEVFKAMNAGAMDAQSGLAVMMCNMGDRLAKGTHVLILIELTAFT